MYTNHMNLKKLNLKHLIFNYLQQEKPKNDTKKNHVKSIDFKL